MTPSRPVTCLAGAAVIRPVALAVAAGGGSGDAATADRVWPLELTRVDPLTDDSLTR
jgi:hypothetical protein